jgi:hypothetical protein
MYCTDKKDDSSEDGSENFEVSETDENFDNINPLIFTENSGLYVISIDGVPRFYVKDVVSASDKIWDISRRLMGDQFFTGYNSTFIKLSENEIHIIGSFRLFLIAYDTVLHRISYSKIEECVKLD